MVPAYPKATREGSQGSQPFPFQCLSGRPLPIAGSLSRRLPSTWGQGLGAVSQAGHREGLRRYRPTSQDLHFYLSVLLLAALAEARDQAPTSHPLRCPRGPGFGAGGISDRAGCTGPSPHSRGVAGGLLWP